MNSKPSLRESLTCTSYRSDLEPVLGSPGSQFLNRRHYWGHLRQECPNRAFGGCCLLMPTPVRFTLFH